MSKQVFNLAEALEVRAVPLEQIPRPPLSPMERRLEQLADKLVGKKNIRFIEDQLLKLRKHYDHGNRVLHYDELLTALLLAFYNPTARSLRTIEALASSRICQELCTNQICRSSFSDAMKLFDPELLTPLIRELQSQIPSLKNKEHKELDQIVRKIVAADGSYYSIYADVAWALIHTKSNGKKQGQIRLDLQIDAEDWTPLSAGISGNDGRSEGAALSEKLLADVIYLIDRNFIDFVLLSSILEKDSDFVVRCRSNAPKFVAQEEKPLSQEDLEHGVMGDRVGHLPGSGGDTPPPPRGLLREVCIFQADEPDKPLRLLTSLLEVPAYVIGLLYRKRWEIELFFRWLKVWANFEHLISHSRNGLLLQFYAAVIGVLLMYVRSGRRPSRYAYQMLHLVSLGQASLEDVERVLARRERERDLERARLARKKSVKKGV